MNAKLEMILRIIAYIAGIVVAWFARSPLTPKPTRKEDNAMSDLSVAVNWLVSRTEEVVTAVKTVLSLAEGNVTTLKDVGILLKAVVPTKDLAILTSALTELQKLAADAVLVEPTNMDLQTISQDLADCVAALTG